MLNDRWAGTKRTVRTVLSKALFNLVSHLSDLSGMDVAPLVCTCEAKHIAVPTVFAWGSDRRRILFAER